MQLFIIRKTLFLLNNINSENVIQCVFGWSSKTLGNLNQADHHSRFYFIVQVKHAPYLI